MRIQELQIEGYRSLKNVVWKPDALNVLIGPNGGGKTNLIKALEFLSICGQGDLAEYVKKEGGMRSLVWDAKQDGSLRMKVVTNSSDEAAYSLAEIVIQGRPTKKRGIFSYGIELKAMAKGSSYDVLAEQLNLMPEGAGAPITLIDWQWLHGARILSESDEISLSPEAKDLSAEKTLLSAVSPWTSPTADGFRSSLASWAIHQEFYTGHYAEVRKPAMTRYEKTVSPDGQNLISVLHTLYNESETFKEELDAAMQAVFGDTFKGIHFSPAADQYIQMRVRWRHLKNPVSAGDLSDGTLRFLFLITILANPEPPPLIVIEEPEIGLHPRMMAVVAEYALQAAERSQVIFTTHSPEFLSAFRDKIPTTTVCEWKDGETVLRTVSGDDLDYWLKEYSLGELFTSGQLESFE
jgi:predicted ATPase